MTNHLLDGVDSLVGQRLVLEHCCWGRRGSMLAIWAEKASSSSNDNNNIRVSKRHVDLQKASSSSVRPNVSGNMK